MNADELQFGRDFFNVCVHAVDHGIVVVDEALFYAVYEDREQLWAGYVGDEFQVAGSMPLKPVIERFLIEEPPLGPLPLVEELIRSRVGISWPVSLVEEGLVKREEYDGMFAALESELDANANRARDLNPTIVQAAEALGLYPRPLGTSPHRWRARCPGTNHDLLIGGDSNTFGCGYCGRKGDIEELRRFVTERRRQP